MPATAFGIPPRGDLLMHLQPSGRWVRSCQNCMVDFEPDFMVTRYGDCGVAGSKKIMNINDMDESMRKFVLLATNQRLVNDTITRDTFTFHILEYLRGNCTQDCDTVWNG